MPIDFPDSPTLNQQFTAGDRTWTYDGTRWESVQLEAKSAAAVSSDITLENNKKYFVDTTVARTLTLPATPNLGDEIQLFDAAGLASTNNVTIDNNSNKINGSLGSITINTDGFSTEFVYTGSSYGWSQNIAQGAASSAGPTWYSTSPLPLFTKGAAYSEFLEARIDELQPISYSLFSGTLPIGLSLNSATGEISGTPTSDLTVTFTIRASDAFGNYVDKEFLMRNVGPIWQTPTSLAVIANSPALISLSAIDDSGQLPTYYLVSGTLPAGLSLSIDGVLSGTSTGDVGTISTFTIRAIDNGGEPTEREFQVEVLGSTALEDLGRFDVISDLNSVSISFDTRGADPAITGSTDIVGDQYWKVLTVYSPTYVGQNCRVYFRTKIVDNATSDLTSNAYNADVQIAAFEINGSGNGIEDFANSELSFETAISRASSQPTSWQAVPSSASNGLWSRITGRTGSSTTGRLVPPLNTSFYIYSETSSPASYGDSIWGRSYEFSYNGAPISMLVGTDAGSAEFFEAYIAPA